MPGLVGDGLCGEKCDGLLPIVGAWPLGPAGDGWLYAGLLPKVGV